MQCKWWSILRFNVQGLRWGWASDEWYFLIHGYNRPVILCICCPWAFSDQGVLTVLILVTLQLWCEHFGSISGAISDIYIYLTKTIQPAEIRSPAYLFVLNSLDSSTFREPRWRVTIIENRWQDSEIYDEWGYKIYLKVIIRWWQLKYFVFSPWSLGKWSNPIWLVFFSSWVGSTTN